MNQFFCSRESRPAVAPFDGSCRRPWHRLCSGEEIRSPPEEPEVGIKLTVRPHRFHRTFPLLFKHVQES